MRALLSLLCLLPIAACVTDAAPTPETASQPRVGVAGSTDAADRDCNIVLRTLERTTDASGDPQTNGASWIWSGVVEVSTAAAAGGTVPQIMWAPAATASTATWQVATGVLATDGSATPGFAKYTVTIDHDAAGPESDAPFVVAAYLPTTGGGRLFDHNRNPGDFDNYTLSDPDWAIYDANGTCEPASSPDAATLAFNSDFTVTRTGILTAGGTITVHYDAARLAGCAEVQQGRNQWGITAHVQFDSGDLLEANVLDVDATFGVPTDGPSKVSLWFEATNVDGCHMWDSNENANYVYALAMPPQWVGLATNTMSRDTSVQCGAADALAGFAFDTWARVEAAETNLCFQVYQVGETDVQDPRSVAGARHRAALATRRREQRGDRVGDDAGRPRWLRRQQRELCLRLARDRSVPRLSLSRGRIDADLGRHVSADLGAVLRDGQRRHARAHRGHQRVGAAGVHRYVHRLPEQSVAHRQLQLISRR